MAQIINITSEALQATIRRLLPSQQGFGEDLQATNVVQPIIDLTASAEGSDIPTSFGQALSYDVTAFNQTGAGTSGIVNNTGFFRVIGGVEIGIGTGSAVELVITDGFTPKTIVKWLSQNGSGQTMLEKFDLVVCVGAGETLSVTVAGSTSACIGSSRQIGLLDGTLVNPTAYAPQ